jgi:hypothetical protein
MSYTVHPYKRAHEATDYPVFSNALNPYNYKDLGNQFQPYQKQQDMYYNTRQLNPISLLKNGPQWMDPLIIPQIIDQLYMKNTSLNYLEQTNQYQTPKNNAMLWNVNKPAKAGYYSLRDPSYPRQISSIQAGQATSFQVPRDAIILSIELILEPI